MYLITKKEKDVDGIKIGNNEVLMWDTDINYQPNGYPVLPNKNVAFPINEVNIFEIETIPSEIVEMAHCYTQEIGFYENPDFIAPNNEFGVANEIYNEIKQSIVNEIVKEVRGQ